MTNYFILTIFTIILCYFIDTLYILYKLLPLCILLYIYKDTFIIPSDDFVISTKMKHIIIKRQILCGSLLFIRLCLFITYYKNI